MARCCAFDLLALRAHKARWHFDEFLPMGSRLPACREQSPN
jgi:hypothetical protein